MPRELSDLLLGSDPKLRRMLRYWAATGVFYAISLVVLLQVADATSPLAGYASMVVWFCCSGVLFFFTLVRFSHRLGIEPWLLALAQGMFAMTCEVLAYAVIGPIRGATLVILQVVIVFCIFSLRPRAIMGLCAYTIALLGATMAALVRLDPVAFPPRIELSHFALSAAALVAVTLLTGEMAKLRARLKRQKEELQAALGTIRTLATIDELTSLANRRHMNEVLHTEERRQPRAGESTCIALLDIDHYTRINDTYGHDGGDAVLRTFAAAARAELRSADVLARWGGEEFLLMLPDTDLREAQRVLRRITERVGAIRVPDLDVAMRISFSGGVVQRRPGEAFTDTITRADHAMYEAKRAGRDMVIAG
ncbi:MAG: diguanylate cyclase [Gammaproteobacteria bacterium]